MNLPFTRSEFFDVFARYNRAVWPLQFVLVGLALLALWAIVRRWHRSDRLASAALALLWLWVGIVYQVGFFAEINAVAIGFGVMFVFQAWAFFHSGIKRHRLRFAAHNSWRTVVGAIVMTYALTIYPPLAFALDDGWPQVPTFGAPCPVVLFTLGLLLWTTASLPKWLLVVPLLWAAVATSAALWFRVYEDWALLPVGVIAAGWLVLGSSPRPERREQRKQTEAHRTTRASRTHGKHRAHAS
jgi:hypothetical protein